jgi:hypothetical protein
VLKKLLCTAVFLSIFLLAVCGTQFVGITKANPIGENIFNEPPVITIESPLNNETFSLDNVQLIFTLTKPEVSEYDGWLDESSVWATHNWTDLRNKVVYVNITLDGKMYRSIEVNSYLSSPFNSSLNLANLEDGVHSVQIHIMCDGVALEYHGLWEHSISYSNSSDIVYFTVDATPPAIVIMPIESKTYGVTDIPLNFTLNEPTSQITYSLDGQANMTIAGNTTLTGLSNGVHSVTVYATDEAGNTGASETISFNVNVPGTFPTELVTVAGASVGFVSVGLVVYNVKIKKRMKKS